LSSPLAILDFGVTVRPTCEIIGTTSKADAKRLVDPKKASMLHHPNFSACVLARWPPWRDTNARQ
jgi:hypothetical protein